MHQIWGGSPVYKYGILCNLGCPVICPSVGICFWVSGPYFPGMNSKSFQTKNEYLMIPELQLYSTPVEEFFLNEYFQLYEEH